MQCCFPHPALQPDCLALPLPRDTSPSYPCRRTGEAIVRPCTSSPHNSLHHREGPVPKDPKVQQLLFPFCGSSPSADQGGGGGWMRGWGRGEVSLIHHGEKSGSQGHGSPQKGAGLGWGCSVGAGGPLMAPWLNRCKVKVIKLRSPQLSPAAPAQGSRPYCLPKGWKGFPKMPGAVWFL